MIILHIIKTKIINNCKINYGGGVGHRSKITRILCGNVIAPPENYSMYAAKSR